MGDHIGLAINNTVILSGAVFIVAITAPVAIILVPVAFFATISTALPYFVISRGRRK